METADHGIETIKGTVSVAETVDRLLAMLRERGIRMFALIDHSGEAEKIGMRMPDTKLLIFGSPRAGTPLMLGSPDLAIDLPLKLLVRDDGHGQTLISWNSPDYLLRRHGLPLEFNAILGMVKKLAESVAG